MSREKEFRSEGSGHWLLQALFLEQSYTNKTNVKYTLKNYDHAGYPSLYRLYMEEMDPTEVIFAKKHLGGWQHWRELTKCTWFKPYIAVWREELELTLRAKALANVRSFAADSESKSCYEANKFLLNGNWLTSEEKKQRKVGRPSKEAIKDELKRQAEEEKQLLEEFNRIN